jgi:hypothetical protein
MISLKRSLILEAIRRYEGRRRVIPVTSRVRIAIGETFSHQRMSQEDINAIAALILLNEEDTDE